MTTDAVIARVHAAGWFVEDLRERRGPTTTWPQGHWYASVRNRTGERIECGVGRQAAEALQAALLEATVTPMPADLAELL